jgi:hypothetical protein
MYDSTFSTGVTEYTDLVDLDHGAWENGPTVWSNLDGLNYMFTQSEPRFDPGTSSSIPSTLDFAGISDSRANNLFPTEYASRPRVFDTTLSEFSTTLSDFSASPHVAEPHYLLHQPSRTLAYESDRGVLPGLDSYRYNSTEQKSPHNSLIPPSDLSIPEFVWSGDDRLFDPVLVEGNLAPEPFQTTFNSPTDSSAWSSYNVFPERQMEDFTKTEPVDQTNEWASVLQPPHISVNRIVEVHSALSHNERAQSEPRWSSTELERREQGNDIAKSRRRLKSAKILKSHEGAQTKPLPCMHSGCTQKFRYRKDLQRHIRSVHEVEGLAWGIVWGTKWFCGFDNCKFGIQGFVRKDKFLQHCWTHKEEIDMTKREWVHRYHWFPFTEFKERSQSEEPPRLSRESELFSSGHTNRRRPSSADNRKNGKTLKNSNSESNLGSHSTVLSKMALRPKVGNGTWDPDNLSKPGVSFEEAKRYVCDVLNCGVGFRQVSNLRRHQKSVHPEMNNQGKGHMCPFEDCWKPAKVWPRPDNFRKHLEKKHGVKNGSEEMDALVQTSLNRSPEDGVYPFIVTTLDAQLPRKRAATSDIRTQLGSKSRLQYDTTSSNAPIDYAGSLTGSGKASWLKINDIESPKINAPKENISKVHPMMEATRADEKKPRIRDGAWPMDHEMSGPYLIQAATLPTH